MANASESVIARAWHAVQRILAVLTVCRFSVLGVLIPALLLAFVPQGQEILRISAVDATHTVPIVVATLLLGVMAWYWARTLLALKIPRLDHYDGLDAAAREIPRLLGAAPPLALAVACMSAASPAGPASGSLRWAAVLLALAAPVLWAVFHYRRRAVQAVGQYLAGAKPRVFRFVGEPLRRVPKTVAFNTATRVADLSRGNLIFAAATWGFSAVLLSLFSVDAVYWGPRVGSVVILLVAAASWIPFGSFLEWWAAKSGFPVVTALILMVVLFSHWNDNHAIRTFEGTNPLPDSVEGRLATWRTYRLGEQPRGDKAPIPLFVVAAEGGGIRAAYWTAIVLAKLQDEHPAFARHVFAISGVSGGALGAATFAALIARGPHAACGVRGGTTPYEQCADSFLAGDFLSPLLGAMLYPDLVQRFLPFKVLAADRSHALEAGWERQWWSMSDSLSNVFAQPFPALWVGDTAALIPALVFTGTSVETGRRIMTAQPFAFPFVNASDGVKEVGKPMPLSTAVHMSARFTYFSPAGVLDREHVVDGGYFDNSGAIAAGEIIDALRQRLGTDTRFVVVPVIIENDLEDTTVTRSAWLNEPLSPVLAMMNTRTARASLAKARLARDPNIIRFTIGCSGVTLPLGWALSSIDRAAMRSQLDSTCPGGPDNPAERRKVTALLK